MPCYDSRDDEYNFTLKSETDKLSAFLCATLYVLEQEGYYGLIQKINERESGVSVYELNTWWINYKTADKARRDKERKKIVEEEKRKLALDKLSDEEKSLLGLK